METDSTGQILLSELAVEPQLTISEGRALSRKYKGNLNGERYVANTSPYKREVHDLDNENRNCLVDEIIRAGQDKAFGSLADARREEFGECPFCRSLVDNSAAIDDSPTNALAGIRSRLA